mgnify:CR=1 FL=1
MDEEICDTSMKSCRHCQTPIEPLELSCRVCGHDYVSPLPVSDRAPSKHEMAAAYESCLERGRTALSAGDFEEAVNLLREAVKRSRQIEDAEVKEIEARKLLGQSFERLDKISEAADQYRIISQLTADEILREVWLKKYQDLIASSTLAFDQLFRREDFRDLIEDEGRFVPLYCSGCKRLLAEAEVYAFRRGFSETTLCWCGVHERPLAKADATHERSLAEGRGGRGQRSRAIEVASRDLPGGKTRETACILALTLGFVGAQKFYLGDRVLGWNYVFWSLTLIPYLLSIYEAVVLSHMSLVSFNMTYNLDLVLQEISPEDSEKPSRLDVFSLEAAEAQQEVI